MNGAESLVKTLASNDVTVCFANPGTSEMHFVAALDRVPGVRCVLCLFEGVATGAADGYARMLDKPAATLLHLGPGYANGVANLHNAKKANTPIVNVVGDHATYHRKFDAPLTSDIETLAKPMSHWVKSARTSDTVGPTAAEAITEARTAPGRIATLILPADTAWGENGVVGVAKAPPARRAPGKDEVVKAAKALRDGPALLLLGNTALRARLIELGVAIGAASGAKVMAQPRDSRTERGAGRAAIGRLPNAPDPAIAFLKDFKSIVLVGAVPPMAFFAFPGKPSLLTAESTVIHNLAGVADDPAAALQALADELGERPNSATREALAKPDLPTGGVTPEKLGAAIAALLPENAIVVDEAVTTGRPFFGATKGAEPHDYLGLTGGSIGWGPPAAVGAAVACPDRKIITLQGDGSAAYTCQALWTQAREKLDVLTVLFANNAYNVLRFEMKNMGIMELGDNAKSMLNIGNPEIDWVSLAKGFGVEGAKVTSMEEFAAAFSRGVAYKGPYLLHVTV